MGKEYTGGWGGAERRPKAQQMRRSQLRILEKTEVEENLGRGITEVKGFKEGTVTSLKLCCEVKSASGFGRWSSWTRPSAARWWE